MASRQHVMRLAHKIERIAEAQNPAIPVAVFKGETPEFAKRRHAQLRPDHLGKRIRLSWRPDARDPVREILAAHSEAEIAVAIDDASTGLPGEPIGTRVLRERDAKNAQFGAVKEG